MPDQNESGSNKKKKIGFGVLFLILMIVGAVIYYMHYSKYHISTDDAFIDGTIYTVTPQISGKVTEVIIDDNQFVEKDQILVTLDTSDLEVDLHTARQNLSVVRNQIAGQYAQINVIEAQMEQLEAQRDLISMERERLANLLAGGAISQGEFDRIEAQWKAINAQITAADSQRQQIMATIGPRDKGGGEAAIRFAEASIAQIELKLGYAKIKAPTSGYITRKNVTVGEVVNEGQPIMSIVPLEDLYITANYKETQLTNVKPGMSVVFEVDTYPGVEFKGRVESIMAGTGSVFSLIPPQNATGNYIKVVQRIPVKIDLKEVDVGKYPLRIGMSVVPTILVND